MEKSDVKQSAVQFLKLIVDGRIDDAYQKYADMDGKHHNIFTPAGFRALKNAMKENDIRFPGKRLVIKDVLVDGDLVAVHSNLILYK
ncbi:MAG: nuclear transport factor 2 family protein, partial [Candidatus Micrarchaeota archaeon]|nr:nuclear transport factor 2 family protein [Candidatus Micrarchaeota archaeon]